MKISKLIFAGIFGLIFLATSCLEGTENENIEKSILGKWEIIEEREYSNDKLTSTVARSGDFFEFKDGNKLIRTNPQGTVSNFDYKIVDKKFLVFEAEEFGTIKTIQFEITLKSKDLMYLSRSLSPPNRYELEMVKRK